MKPKIYAKKRIDKVFEELRELYDFNRKIQRFKFVEKKVQTVAADNSGKPPRQS